MSSRVAPLASDGRQLYPTAATTRAEVGGRCSFLSSSIARGHLPRPALPVRLRQSGARSRFHSLSGKALDPTLPPIATQTAAITAKLATAGLMPRRLRASGRERGGWQRRAAPRRRPGTRSDRYSSLDRDSLPSSSTSPPQSSTTSRFRSRCFKRPRPPTGCTIRSTTPSPPATMSRKPSRTRSGGSA